MRFSDWEIRLSEFIKSRQNTNFQRGEHDCALFACDCIEVMTGVDPGKWFRGRYKTKRGAAMALRKYGGTLSDVAENICREMGYEEVHVNKAQRGDVVLIRTDESEALGIVDLDGSHILLADQGVNVGVGTVPISMATKAWRVA